MSGNNPRMRPLELRKQFLIAESELNRAQLADDWAVMSAGIRSFIGRTESFGSIVSGIALLVTGLAAIRRARSASADARPSWWRTILSVAGVISSAWMALRAKRPDRENQESRARA
jgi:hypothetical protein